MVVATAARSREYAATSAAVGTCPPLVESQQLVCLCSSIHGATQLRLVRALLLWYAAGSIYKRFLYVDSIYKREACCTHVHGAVHELESGHRVWPFLWNLRRTAMLPRRFLYVPVAAPRAPAAGSGPIPDTFSAPCS